MAKSAMHMLDRKSLKHKMLKTNTPEHLVKQMSEESRRQALASIDAQFNGKPVHLDSERQESFFSNVMTNAFLSEQLEQDAVSREEMLNFLAEPLPAPGNNEKDIELYHRNLDVRVQHIAHLTSMAESSLEIQQEIVNAGFALRVLDMLAVSDKKPSVMAILIKALRVVATQEVAVEQLLIPKYNFCALVVSLLKQTKDSSLRIEASALIALLTIVRDLVEALKEKEVVPVLTSLLSSPMGASDQAVYNNGIVALVRIIAVSGDSIADDLKRAQAVTPLCNIVNKFQADRSQPAAVLDAVVTLLTILSASPEIALQIVSRGCVPALSKILALYVDFASGVKASERDFRRITQTSADTPSTKSSTGAQKQKAAQKNGSSAESVEFRSAISEEEESFVDDEDVGEDEINPIYRGSDPEDILPLIRLLSRIPSARPQMIQYDVPKSLAALIALPELPYTQKTQATNALVNFAAEEDCVASVTSTDIARILSLQTFDSGTSAEEIMFQSHALAVLALFSAHDSFQRHVAPKYWLTSVIPRAAKTNQIPVQQAIGTILLSLLRSDEHSDNVRDIIAESEAIRSTISHLVRQDQLKKASKSVWSAVFALT